MLCREGKLSLFCFVVTALISLLPELFLRLELGGYNKYFQNVWFLHLFQYGCLNLFLLLTFRDFHYQIAVRAAFLGYIVGVGLITSFTAPPSWRIFGVYAAILAIFHYTEFLAIAWTNPAVLSIDSFVLNHSIAYGVAACSSWLEFIVERWFFPKMKEPSLISYFGIIACIAGELLRKMAIFTAKHNFNHIVQNAKSQDHELVTYGVYGICRHPSYVGWFYWSIGTQLILQNPFCILAYAITSWRFFHDRVLIEEVTLLNFFGEAYVNYQKRVGTGLPFISGYKVDL